ncbi:hypothetical protein HDC92_001825 [Pedobacter sp. AK017]|uniref:hypothetical protein n=1 Tax=Pedobacter sp. AK017 TaxID=2723073 RepID=UPI00160B32E8|nr:hypothetical protein [Pedobacter sp. AK017]MBB5438150.1 hypothetical protein [Pedobacter sp. AK017]
MKTHTTTTLHNLVVYDLDPAADAMDLNTIENWLNDLPKITKELYCIMNFMVFSPVSDRLVNRHFRQIQNESIFLINTLEGYREMTKILSVLQTAVLKCLEDILLHIENHHNQFFNLDLVIPAGSYAKAVLEIEADMNPMFAALRGKNVDKNLQRLIEGSLSDFMKAGNCTYYRLAYMKGLQESLNLLCQISGHDEINERLREYLFYNNLNTAAHTAYYKKEIQKQLTETFKVREQQELLFAYQKQFRGWQQQKTCAFSPKNDGIKALLSAYIKAEIKYLANKLKGDTTTAHRVLTGKTIPIVYHIPVTFSVDALAYFFKLLVKAGVIEAGSKNRLLLLLANQFKTPGIGNGVISTNSISTKYKQVVQTTAKAVRVVLVRMLKLLDEEFGLA